jgi:hypothetical protein
VREHDLDRGDLVGAVRLACLAERDRIALGETSTVWPAFVMVAVLSSMVRVQPSAVVSVSCVPLTAVIVMAPNPPGPPMGPPRPMPLGPKPPGPAPVTPGAFGPGAVAPFGAVQAPVSAPSRTPLAFATAGAAGEGGVPREARPTATALRPIAAVTIAAAIRRREPRAVEVTGWTGATYAGGVAGCSAGWPSGSPSGCSVGAKFMMISPGFLLGNRADRRRTRVGAGSMYRR